MADMEKLKETMVDKKIWAVLGATPNKEKFGYKIWKKLKDHNYKVYGINPNRDNIDGEKLYDTITDLPEKVDVVDFVVSPKISINALKEAKEKDIEYLWFQPGSFDEEVINKAKEMGFKIVYHDCILAVLTEKEKNM